MPTNSNYAFTVADFGFTDPTDAASAAGANALLAVKITSLPAGGTLPANGTAVAINSFIAVADIAAGKLIFTSDGTTGRTMNFAVQDNGGTASGGVDLDQ